MKAPNEIALQKLINNNKNLSNKQGKFKSFRLDVNRWFTTVDGEIIDKNSVPSNLRTAYPVFLFGNYDKDGNYWIGQKNLPAFNRLQFYFIETYKGYFDQLTFSGFNNVIDKFSTGDILQVYTDNIKAPNYFVWLQISGERRAYSSILSNPANQTVFKTKFFTDDERQYLQNLIFVDMDDIGDYVLDYVNPLTFKTSDYAADGFIDIPVPFTIQKNFGLYFYFDFNADLNSFIFNYNK